MKNFFLTPERTFRRKAQEALLAFVLERRAQKKDILELYMNEVYLGQVGSFGIQGIGQAARMYFQKDVGNLTLPEAALLAGMIQSPNPYNPYRHPKRALERRNQVLRAMQDAGFITPQVAEAAIAEPVEVKTASLERSEAPYFIDLVKTQLAERYAQKDLATQNLAVYTSLDLPAAEPRPAGPRPGAGPRREDDQAEEERGPAAGRPHRHRALDRAPCWRWSAAASTRAASSTAPPPRGGSRAAPSSRSSTSPPSRPPSTTPRCRRSRRPRWSRTLPPSSSSAARSTRRRTTRNTYKGYVTLRTALAHSLNVATVKVAEMIGYDRVANLWTKKMGMGGDVKPYPAIALGSFEATPLEMAGAYNVLANLGVKVSPTTVLSVVDERNVTLPAERHPPRRGWRGRSRRSWS